MSGCGPEWHSVQFHWTMVVSDLIILKLCSQLAGAAMVSAWRDALGYSRAWDMCRAEAAGTAALEGRPRRSSGEQLLVTC
jgi:hypothetical protein